MTKYDRERNPWEAARVVRFQGVVLFSFVHRYWCLKGFFVFLQHYVMWAREKVVGRRTELGDSVELIQGTLVRFYAFTLRQAKTIFPENVRLSVWKRSRGPFTDWFFIAGRKSKHELVALYTQCFLLK